MECKATYSRTGVSHNGTKRVCLQHIMYKGQEIADHLWIEISNSPKLGGNETVQFTMQLIKRKRPGPTITSGPITDIQSKLPVVLKIVK